jgi:hypothetical protein
MMRTEGVSKSLHRDALFILPLRSFVGRHI